MQRHWKRNKQIVIEKTMIYREGKTERQRDRETEREREREREREHYCN